MIVNHTMPGGQQEKHPTLCLAIPALASPYAASVAASFLMHPVLACKAVNLNIKQNLRL